MLNKNSCNNNIVNQEYKLEDICAANNCTNKPISLLKVKYINKTGSFCKQHTEDLMQIDLVEEMPKGKI